MSLSITFPITFAILAGLFSAPLATGADRRIQVEAAATRSVVAAMLQRPKKAEIQLKDGTGLSGTLIRAGMSGLLVEAKGGTAGVVQVLPYEQLSTIRIDLGPDRGWQGLGVALGFTAAFATLLASVQQDSGDLEKAGGILMIGGPIGGATLLGYRHRSTLTIEVT